MCDSKDPARYEEAGKFARTYLVKTATDSVAYVAFGKVLCHDLVTEFGLTEAEARRLVDAISVDLMDKIQKL